MSSFHAHPALLPVMVLVVLPVIVVVFLPLVIIIIMLPMVIVVVVPFPGMVFVLHNAFEISMIVLLPSPAIAFLFTILLLVFIFLLHEAFEIAMIILLPFPVLAFLFALPFPIIVIGGTGDDTYGAEGQQGQKDFELHLGDSMN